MSDFVMDFPVPDDERARILAWLNSDQPEARLYRFSVEALGIGPGVTELDDLNTRPTAEAVEDIPAGSPVVVDLDLGLAARPFDAERRDRL